MTSSTPPTFLEAIERGPLLCDGAMGTLLYGYGVSLEHCLDETNLSKPALVLRAHSEYLAAGAQIVETNTFGANRVKLEENDIAGQASEINAAGARLARQAVALSGRHAYVAGSVGPLGRGMAPFGPISVATARAVFEEQIAALAAGGVDLLLFETFSDLDEIEVAIEAAYAVAPGLPIVAQMTFVEEQRTLAGHSPEDVANTLCGLGVTVAGVNCSAGPSLVLRAARRMQASCPKLFYSVQPNAGYPTRQSGRLMYPSSPAYFGDFARQAAAAGMRIIGGCCGTSPEHTAAMATALRGLPMDPTTLPQLASFSEPKPGEPPPPTRLAQALGHDVTVAGVNCSAGPSLVLRAAWRMQASCPKLFYSVQPNAGYPTRQSGRLMYPSSPAYFGDFARQAAAAGMRIIGGCCGTSPEHTAAMAAALRGLPMDPATLPQLASFSEPKPGEPPPPTGLAQALGREFVITVEMHPPRGIDLLGDSGQRNPPERIGCDCAERGRQPAGPHAHEPLGLRVSDPATSGPGDHPALPDARP